MAYIARCLDCEQKLTQSDIDRNRCPHCGINFTGYKCSCGYTSDKEPAPGEKCPRCSLIFQS